ncbi:MAG: 3'-5' exonuclease [Sphaerochaetaceae bacterium]
MRYVALDFETANSAPTSACSIGLARMSDGEVLDTWYSLIQPAAPYFSPMNISIHHITPADVADAPTFEDIWPDVLFFMGDDLLIAHNAPFDMGILRATLAYYGLPVPRLNYTCTVRISRRIWPELPSHRLTDLSRLFGFDYQAHQALEDAINCGKLFHKACPGRSETEVKAYLLGRGIQYQRL